MIREACIQIIVKYPQCLNMNPESLSYHITNAVFVPIICVPLKVFPSARSTRAALHNWLSGWRAHGPLCRKCRRQISPLTPRQIRVAAMISYDVLQCYLLIII